MNLRLTLLGFFLFTSSAGARPVAYTTIPSEDVFSFDLLQGELNATGKSEIGLFGYTHWFSNSSPFRWGLGLVGSVSGTTSGFFGGSVGLAYTLGILKSLRLDLSASTGAAGGGDVKTGGGLFVQPRLSLGWQGSSFSLGAGAGALVFPLNGGMQAVHPFVEIRAPNQWTITPGTAALPDGDLWDPQRWRRDRWRFAAVGRKFFTAKKTAKSGTKFTNNSLALIVHGDHFVTPSIFTTVELGQAVSNIQDFRLVGAGFGLSIEIVDDVYFEPVAKIGLAGGGDVSTGQGLYFDGGGRVLVEVVRGATLRAEGGVFRAFNSRAEFGYLGGGIGINFRGSKRKTLAGEMVTEVHGNGMDSTFDLDLGLSHWLTTAVTADDTSVFQGRLTYRPLPYVAVFGRVGSGAGGSSTGLGMLDVGGGLVLPLGLFDVSVLGSVGSAGGGPVPLKGQFQTVALEGGAHLGEHLGLYGGVGKVFFDSASFTSVHGGLKIRFGFPWAGGSKINNVRKYDPKLHEPDYRRRPEVSRPPPPPATAPRGK